MRSLASDWKIMFKALRSIMLCLLCFGLVSVTPTAAAAPKIDTSPRAQQLFTLWWNYENISTSDAHITLQQAYNTGVTACKMKIQGYETGKTLQTLKVDGGYTNIGIDAVYRGAVEALCPSFVGYRGAFDQEMASIIGRLQLATTPPLHEMDYGWFRRGLCTSGTTTLQDMYNFIVTQRQLAIVQAYGNNPSMMQKIIDTMTPCRPYL